MAKPTIFRFPLIRFPLDEFCREVDDRFSLSVRVGELSYNSAHFVTPKTLVPSLALSLSLSGCMGFLLLESRSASLYFSFFFLLCLIREEGNVKCLKNVCEQERGSKLSARGRKGGESTCWLQPSSVENSIENLSAD